MSSHEKITSKVLVIRFSSIGDVTQALSIPWLIRQKHPESEIHFLTKIDFIELMKYSPYIHKTWGLKKSKNFLSDLIQIKTLCAELNTQNFTHVYDAHNNMRSLLVRLFVHANKKLVRPMYRWKRFLLIKFKINLFEKPFSGQRDLLKPLEKWKIPFQLPDCEQLFLSSQTISNCSNEIKKQGLTQYVVLAPSAAHALKRWPISHWKKLIQMNSDIQFVVLAGPQDQFTNELSSEPNVLNLTGKTSLIESAAYIKESLAIVSNDTGLLHFAEQLQRPTVALMGPAPFGFPSLAQTTILEKNLPCRPCSKHGQGPCTNPRFHECLDSISPLEVHIALQSKLQKLWAHS